MLEALLLAVALAMDATAVAAARAVAGLSRRGALLLAGSFGAFQAGMAAAGWAAGAGASAFIAPWDHWVAFVLLSGIGGKMAFDGLRGPGEAPPTSPLDPRAVLLLSLATSIDALAAGVTLPTLNVAPPTALVAIGLATFLLSLAGALGGRALGARFGPRLTLLGGATLIALGVATLVEHLGS